MAQEIGVTGLIDTWASSGSKEEPGLSKKETGWEAGERPPHEFFNHLLSEIGQKLNYLLRNGVPEWSSAITYTVGSMTQYGGDIYTAIAGNTNSTPSGSSPHWRRYLRASESATETARGVIELATNAEVQTGTDTERAVTPAGLASLTSTTARRGLVEIATTAETQAYTDTDRAITPGGLSAAFQALRSVGSSGYQRLPGGLIIQWGQWLTTGGNAGTVGFPVDFPNACLSVQVTCTSSAANDYIATVSAKTASQFSVRTANGSGAAINVGFEWLAIGY